MNKKLEWTANVLTEHIMKGAETVTHNKEEMTDLMTSTVMTINAANVRGRINAIDKAKINGGIVGFGLGVGCCSVIAYYMNQNQKKNRQVESK